MRVVEERVQGWRTCARPQEELPRDCEGYTSEQCEVVVITTWRTFGDLDERSHGQSPDLSGILADSLQRILPADGDDSCQHCGGPVNLSLEPRTEYPRLSKEEPDERLWRARGRNDALWRSRADSERADQMLEETRRQNAALEHANALKEREVAALEAQYAHQSAPEPDDDPTPTPARRTRPRAA